MATSRLPAPPAIEPAAGAQRGSGGNGGLAAPPTMRHCQRNRVKRLRDKEGCRSEHISQSKLTRRFSEMHRAGILPAGTNCRRNADQDRTLYSRCRAEVLYVRPDNGPQAAEYLWEDEVIRDPVSTKTAIETAKTANGSRPIEIRLLRQKGVCRGDGRTWSNFPAVILSRLLSDVPVAPPAAQ
jgi:hypothetical protein